MAKLDWNLDMFGVLNCRIFPLEPTVHYKASSCIFSFEKYVSKFSSRAHSFVGCILAYWLPSVGGCSLKRNTFFLMAFKMCLLHK